MAHLRFVRITDRCEINDNLLATVVMLLSVGTQFGVYLTYSSVFTLHTFLYTLTSCNRCAPLKRDPVDREKSRFRSSGITRHTGTFFCVRCREKKQRKTKICRLNAPFVCFAFKVVQLYFRRSARTGPPTE